MGHCCNKNGSVSVVKDDAGGSAAVNRAKSTLPAGTPSANGAVDVQSNKATPAQSFSASPWQSPYPAGVAPSLARTPRRMFKWSFPPPSPAKPIMSAILKWQGPGKPKEGPIPEHDGEEDER